MAAASFFTSAILIVLLVALRRTELKRGERFAPKFRKQLDHSALQISAYLFRTLPGQVAKMVRYVIIHVTDLSSSALLRVVRFIENKLHRFVHAVRGRKQIHRREPSSDYFKDVQNHKEEVSKTIEELQREQQ